MNKVYLIFLALCLSSISHAQSVGIGTTNPDASAMLHIESNSKGLLIPRMTDNQMRMVIAAPAKGLLVFNLTDSSLYMRRDTGWVNLTATVSGWGLQGNAGTDASKNFIGTTDDVDLIFKRNNIRVGLLTNTYEGNIAWGESALNPASTGTDNIAIGTHSLFSNTEGNYNVANGTQSLYSNTTGSHNLGNGTYSLFSNTEGSHNVGNGTYSLFSNTEGSYNVANGTQSLYSNTTGSYNVASGFSSLSSNTTGIDNVANGTQSLASNTTGSGNVAFGSNSLYSNTTGSSNTALGYAAGQANTGDGNVFIGNAAGASATSSNKLYIHNADVDSTGALIYGEFDNKKLAIGGQLGVGMIPSNVIYPLHIKASSTVTGNGLIAMYDNTGTLKWHTKFTGTGDLNFVESGVVENRLVLAKGGNIGIGTATPTTAKLVIKVDNIGDNGIDLSSSNAFADMRVIRNSLNPSDKDLYLGLGGDVTNSSLHLYSNDLETMTIKNGGTYLQNSMGIAGNLVVGFHGTIGTPITPATAKLVVTTDNAGDNGLDLSTSDAYADMRVIRNKNATADKDLYFGFGGNANSSIHLYSNASETMTIKNGKVSIGESSPTRTDALFIQQSIAYSDAYGNNSTPGITFKTVAKDAIVSTFIFDDADYGIRFSENGYGTLSTYLSHTVGSWYLGSDRRLKKDIDTIHNSLVKLLQLKPVNYRYLSSPESSQKAFGFIAQDVLPLFPELVEMKNDRYALNYTGFTPIIVDAMQEQQKIIENQQKQIDNLQQQIDELKKMMEKR